MLTLVTQLQLRMGKYLQKLAQSVKVQEEMEYRLKN